MAEQEMHNVWLSCMQMSNCTPEEALHLVKRAQPFINNAITPTGQNLLMVSCSIGAENIVRECLLHNVRVDLQDSGGRTALHYAASIGNLNIFESLIEEGANPKQQTIGGQTPLTKACIFCQGDIIEWYLNNSIETFQINDHYNKKPLQMLKLSGEGLYEQVSQVYKELTKNEMKE